jgi:hypothetical protein
VRFWRLFTDHPRSVGETYWQHLCFALWIGLSLSVLGIVSVIHAVLPFLFQHTTSDRLYWMVDDLEKRGSGEER